MDMRGNVFGGLRSTFIFHTVNAEDNILSPGGLQCMMLG